MSWITIFGGLLFIGGAVGLAVIIFRKVSTLAKLPFVEQPSLNGKISEEIKTRFSEIKYSNFLPLLLGEVEKSLRKFRLFVLKLDNLFISLIKHARDKSDVLTIRSRAWMEHRRLKKKEDMQMLEKLDKVEVSEGLEKIHKEVAKDEDLAFKEKVEIVNSVEETEVIEPIIGETAGQQPEEEEIMTVSEDEKRYIDAIAQNPKDVDSYRALCDIYLSQQSYSDARACFRQVLKLDPADEATKQKLESIKGLRSGKKK